MISSSPGLPPSPTLSVPSCAAIHQIKPSPNGQGSAAGNVLDPWHRAGMEVPRPAVVRSRPNRWPVGMGKCHRTPWHDMDNRKYTGGRAKAAGALESRTMEACRGMMLRLGCV